MRTLSTTGKYVSLVLGAVVALVPLVVVLLTSLKTAKDYATSGPLDLPRSLTLSNFSTAFTATK